MNNKKKITMLFLLTATAIGAYAQGNGIAGINEATVRPTPLLISNAAIALQEETSQDSGSHNEEDTRTEPRGCGLARIGVTT